MRRLISSAAPAALAAVVVVRRALGAAAQHGNGLYEPFPQAAVKKRAKRFVSRLAIPLRLDDKDLARGVFVTGRALPREGARRRPPGPAWIGAAGACPAACCSWR